MRYLTVKLDKHAAAWAEKRKENQSNSKILIMSIEQQSKGNQVMLGT